jgi:hypothetical protein
MPFNVSPSSYRGGDYLFQGITNAANSITGAIQHFGDTADQAAKADALMQYLSQQSDPVTGKPMIDPKSLQAYQNHSQRQRAYLAGGITAGMSLAQALQHYSQASALNQAKLNAIQQPFMRVDGQLFRQPGGPVPVSATSPVEAGRQQRFEAKQQATALNARIKLAQNQQKEVGTQLEDLGYAGDPGSLLDSSVHKGGVMSGKTFQPTDPANPNNPQTHIQVGGGAAYDIPTFHRLQGIALKHQQLQGIINSGLQQQAGTGVGAAPAGGAAAATGGITTVNTPAEARALPPGTRYRAASWPPGRYAVIPGTAATAAPASDEEATDTGSTDEEE